MPEDRFSLKDHLFNREKVSYLGGLLSRGIPGFDRRSFESEVMAEMPDLELKERIDLISRVLADHLDRDFEVAAIQILNSLPPPLDPTLTDDDFGDFIIAPLGRYVETHGISHFDKSVSLFHELTKRFSMEGPIRAFIDARPKEMLEIYETWVRDDNYHVRRLVSESTRPLLPWAPRISLAVSDPLPLLDLLHADRTRYVTRSVANHLNDVSKIDSSLVIERLTRWRAQDQQSPKELSWMTRHALRTLVKSGHAEALQLLGFAPNPQVEASLVVHTPVVHPGETLEFDVELRAGADEPLLVDYQIHFVKNGGKTRPRVFKLKQLKMKSGETRRITKRHPLRANATTYTLYPGIHELTVVANGTAVATDSFLLEIRAETV